MSADLARRVRDKLAARGVTLAVVGGQLRYHPAETLDPAALAWLRDHKAALIEGLAQLTAAQAELAAHWQAAIDLMETREGWPPEIVAGLRAARVEWGTSQ